MLSLVVAVAENDAIGKGNALPWHLPADLKHFKQLTLGKHVLMGRKTYQSIGKALPQRTNLVLSRRDFSAADARVVPDVGAARAIAGDDPLMVIGGAEIYRLALPEADLIHLTLVHTRVGDADTFFPEWRGSEWREQERQFHARDDKNAFDYTFITLRRAGR
jgi:dihydrofolate reductase